MKREDEGRLGEGCQVRSRCVLVSCNDKCNTLCSNDKCNKCYVMTSTNQELLQPNDHHRQRFHFSS